MPAAHTEDQLQETSAPVFLTGFEPFLGHAVNPSGELVRALMADPPRGVQVVGKVLPVDFRAADEALRVALEGVWALKPVALLSLGVQRRPYYRLERLARARLDSKKTDAAGILARDLEPRGRGVRQTCLDLERLVAVLTAAGAGDARISSDAGGFLCEFSRSAGIARGVPAPAAGGCGGRGRSDSRAASPCRRVGARRRGRVVAHSASTSRGRSWWLAEG